MLRVSLLAVAVSAALCANASAADEQWQPTVQVTASRVEGTVGAALADVSVITREEIEASGAPDVLELLRLQSGIDLYRTGGAGQQTSLFLRGTNSNQVLVLIDGVRVSAATTGAFAFEQLPVEAIERIEIVRGPRASWWGSDAIGGVIQIFTRKLEGPRIAAGYGSHRDARGTAGFGHWNGTNGFSVQVGARHTDGYSATNPGICAGPDDPWCIYNPDDDGYRNTDIVLRGAHALGNQVLSGTLYRNRAQSQFDEGHTDVRQQTLGVNLEGPLAASWTHRLALGTMREDLDTPAYGTQYRTRRASLLWQHEFRIDEHQQVAAGIDLLRESGETIDTYAGVARYDESRTNRAVYGNWRGVFGALDAEASLRHDDNSAFGNATTGTFALGWRVNELVRVYASFGQGFRAPSFNELYDPGYGGYYAGNPDLDPERSRSSEVGIRIGNERHRFTANAYATRVRDLVSFTGPQNQAENIAHASLDGVELEYELDLQPWTLRANWTWQDPRDADTDQTLLRRARHKGALLAERRFGNDFTAGVEVVGAGERDDVGGVRLGGYAIVNLRARWQATPAWSIGIRAENVGDRNYEFVHGYNTSGRSGFIDVAWQPGA